MTFEGFDRVMQKLCEQISHFLKNREILLMYYDLPGGTFSEAKPSTIGGMKDTREISCAGSLAKRQQRPKKEEV
jgi:hypothetical protein